METGVTLRDGTMEVAKEQRSMGEGRRDQDDLFFEVSKKVGSAEMLQGWFEWFRALNIPCAITKSRRGYALWRQGEEKWAQEEVEGPAGADQAENRFLLRPLTARLIRRGRKKREGTTASPLHGEAGMTRISE